MFTEYEPSAGSNPAASIKQVFRSYLPILAALSSRRLTVTICLRPHTRQSILVPTVVQITVLISWLCHDSRIRRTQTAHRFLEGRSPRSCFLQPRPERVRSISALESALKGTKEPAINRMANPGKWAGLDDPVVHFESDSSAPVFSEVEPRPDGKTQPDYGQDDGDAENERVE